jgi:hypothetical protein
MLSTYTLEVEVAGSPETLVRMYQSTQCHIVENHNLNAIYAVLICIVLL